MSPSRIAAGRRTARVLVALAAATACLGAVVAYAATRPSGAHHGLGGHRPVRHPSPPGQRGATGGDPADSPERLLRARLIEAPAAETAASEVQFRFHVPPRGAPGGAPSEPAAKPGGPPPTQTSSRRFECRLDGGTWSECRSPYRLTNLSAGSHRFAVRALNREGRAGEAAGFEWRRTTPALVPAQSAAPVEPGERHEPRRFSVLALRDPEGLYPGLAPTPIPVRVTNPNDVPIEVTALTVAIGDAPASCGAENFDLTPAGVSPQAPLVVPANGSAELPSAGLEAPAIRMLDLPVEQDACRGAEIPLVFGGEAHG